MSTLSWPTPLPTPTRVVETLTSLSRNRGGTYSHTVETIRLADGRELNTDLIRLSPNVDTYSLDLAGRSPRRISHYREDSIFGFEPLAPAITAILSASYPHRSVRGLTSELRAVGLLRQNETVREHEAIAGTQAAIWRLTNGIALDTRPLDVPVHALAHSPGRVRRVLPDADGALNWTAVLPAGESVTLELRLPEESELRAYSFVLGPRTAKHPISVRLEQSADGEVWVPVSGSATHVPTGRAGPSVTRHLGVGATLASATAHGGRRGYRHYRFVAEGPADRDGLLNLTGVRVRLAAPSRFRNSAGVVAVYRYLIEVARRGELDGTVAARALVGSSVPGGTPEYTPVVTLVREERPPALISSRTEPQLASLPAASPFRGGSATLIRAAADA